MSLPPLIGGGAVSYFLLPFEPSGVLVATAVLCATLLAFLLRRHHAWHLIGLAVVALLIGVASAKIETERKATPILGSPIATEVTGRVVLVELQESGRTRLTLDVLSTARPTLRYAPDRVRATARQVPDKLLPGEVVRGVVRLMPPSGPVRPGSYDFAFQSYFDGLGAIGFFLRNPVRADSGPEPAWSQSLAQSVERLRMTIADKIRAVIPGASGEIAAALIAGVRAGIPEAVNEDLRITGLAHVLSISGLHMALAAATIMGSMRALFALSPGFSARYPVKKVAAFVALAGTGFYLLLAGDQVAANRSFLMVAVMLAAILFDRAALSMRNLAIAALIILLITPHEVMGPSFQMSFAATAALIAGYAGWKQWRLKSRRHAPPTSRSPMARVLRYLVVLIGGSVATSILAGSATSIFGAYHFQRVSPLTLLANLATMPIIGILMMPPAVLAVALMPLGLEALPLMVMGFGLDLMLGVAHWLAERSPLDAVGIVPASTLTLFTIALVVGCFTTTRLRLLALPFLFAGTLTFAGRQVPDLYISEDARLIAVRTEEGKLAVNRTRPNAFTTQEWQRAASAMTLVKPENGKGATAAPSDRFLCKDDVCTINNSPGVSIMSLPEGGDLKAHCSDAAVIVIDDATANSRACRGSKQVVLTKRDLAQKGSATITIDPESGKPTVQHALARPYRPWHDHRRFSREARGMAPYKRQPRDEATKPSQQTKPPAGVPAEEPPSTSGSGQPNDPEP
ncbi:ComEC/Rec2 family competence protein [Tianweitania sp.]|uniref:ComEC/Rec2 family competence protein n=1 Tax=Tianweitania sp. TaxID=2021634 RepID=UPI00289CE44F|nr:ComEC/Rec2 family competence protein [Tianweitania sp.]